MAGAPIMVTMRHVRLAGLCANNLRRYFAPIGGDALRRFCTDGLPIAEVEGYGDAIALKVAAVARQDAARG